ncbi:MAG: chromate transporter [Bacillota bacterium]|nr:chromate transporter [Bacillota bacterium]
MTLLRLWWEFFKIGLFSVGGGMATLPFLYEMSDRTGWFTYNQIADMLAVSESTPGPIGINMATYTGFTTAGFWGSLVATLGIITPGIIIVLLIVAVLDRFRKNKYVEAAFYGLRPASTGLIAAAGVLVVEIALLNTEAASFPEIFNIKAIALAAVLLVLTRWVKPTKKLHPIVFIAFSAVAGVLIF